MDVKDLQEKLHKKDGIVVRYTDESVPYVSFPVGNVPLKQFEEFHNYVVKECNGNRWLAIWTLFLRCRQFDLQVEAEALLQEMREPQQDEMDDGNPLGLLNSGE